MSKIDRLIDNRIAQNLFIWFCLFLILLGTIQSDSIVLTAFSIILLLVPVIYINNFFILPFFNKNTLRFFLLFLINTIVFTCIAVFVLATSLEQEFKWSMFLNLFGILVLAITFGSALKISRDSFVRRQEEKNAELKLLKAQLNPHFLFNTLNNLYGLSVLKSDNLPGLMLKLSDLLRYSLYETKENYVPLDKEIQYLENYISLEKIRLEDQTHITFKKTGNFQPYQIAPMLLIVFVENAFKHLTSSEEGENAVSINLEAEESILRFRCKNTFDHTISSTLEIDKEKRGIGLQNAKKRLRLMYPNQHELNIEKEHSSYTVDLKLIF